MYIKRYLDSLSEIRNESIVYSSNRDGGSATKNREHFQQFGKRFNGWVQKNRENFEDLLYQSLSTSSAGLGTTRASNLEIGSGVRLASVSRLCQ